MKKIIFYLFALISLSVQAQYQLLNTFTGINGSFPTGNLILTGDSLYGMTTAGGKYYNQYNLLSREDGYGAIFKIRADGTGFDTLMSFNGINGANPNGGLTLHGDTLYGMTSLGGKSFIINNDTVQFGVIFKINTDGSGFDTLMNFNGINGANPNGGLTHYGDTLYGMTKAGGKFNKGVIFKINTNGSGFDTLMSFNGINGFNPYGDLTISGNVLYGMTNKGGKFGLGNIFKINFNGSGFDTILSFSGKNGAYPSGNLTLSGNVLYGMTSSGGYNFVNVNNPGLGNIFKINIDGSRFDTLMSFSFSIGAGPAGSLALYKNVLYGMTEWGGSQGYGVLFKINTDGSGYDVLNIFSPNIGGNPLGSPIITGDTIYGTNSRGGNQQDGVIFTYVIDTLTNILSYSIGSSKATIIKDSILVEVPYGTNPVQAAYFTLSPGAVAQVGSTVQVSGTTVNNFTNVVPYVVTAQDGIHTQDWYVKVKTNSNAGILTDKEYNIKIYPNPARDIITISGNDFSFETNLIVSIYDLKGHLLVQQPINSNPIQIDVSSLSAGVFIVKLSSDNLSQVFKLIKE